MDKAILRTSITCARVFTLLAVLISGSAHAARFDPFYQTSFSSPDTIAEWAILSGNWQIANGEFVNSSAGALSIATVPEYDAQLPPVPDSIGGDFSLDVYMLIVSSAANARAGVVFDFAGPGNYHEVTLSATGNAQLRSRIDSVSSTVATATAAAPGANRWIHIALVRSNGRSTVRIDGVPVFANVLQEGLPEGDVGLITRNTSARFDDVDALSFGRQDPYIEDFNDGDATRWEPLSGTWSATSNEYRVSAVVATAITKTPLNDMWEVGERPVLPSYTFKVRMLNPYGASGNLVGIAWVGSATGYIEAVFSPTGQARLNQVVNGVRTTIASASYLGGGPNRWFEVEAAHNGVEPEFNAVGYIKVNGVPIFAVAPNLFEGAPALISHWSPARFDDVRAAREIFRPFLENFESDEPLRFLGPNTWSISDGTMNNSTIVPASRAFVQDHRSWHDLADIELRARMINRFGSSGNRVGFTYGERGPVYYEAVFSPTGVAHLRKVVKDVPIPIATAQYEGGERGQWFDAQLMQIGDRTTVKVNGATVFDNVSQPDALGGRLGFVAHWTNASVDDVSFTRIPVTRYRPTPLPNLANPFGPLSFVEALNDRGEAVGRSRTADGTQIAVLWRGGRVIDLGTNRFSSALGINNKSEVVGFSGATAFYWKDGSLRDLGASPDTREPSSGARDINERGQIAGFSCTGDGCPALRWEPDGRIVALEDLPGDGENWGGISAINDSGESVGESVGETDGFRTFTAASWRDDTVEPLDVAPSAAIDINNRGQIVGSAPIDTQQAVIWDPRERIPLPLPAGMFSSQARGINEHAVIVGWSEIERPEAEQRALIWQESSVGNLNDLIACDALPESVLLIQPEDINERGEIAVNAIDTAFNPAHWRRAYLLTPVLGHESCVP
jgi:probable HAF family extracellular repeat protein